MTLLRRRQRRSQNPSTPRIARTATGMTTPMAALAPVESPEALGTGAGTSGGVGVESVADEDVDVDVTDRSEACQFIWKSGAKSVAVMTVSDKVVWGLIIVKTLVSGTSTG